MLSYVKADAGADAPNLSVALPRLGLGGVQRHGHISLVRDLHKQRRQLLHRWQQLPGAVRFDLLRGQHGRHGVRPRLEPEVGARARRAPVRLPLPYDHVHMPPFWHLTDYHPLVPPRRSFSWYKSTVLRSGLDY